MCDFQLQVLKQYLDGGGNVLVMLGEGGEEKYGTNIHFLLEEFGVMVNTGERQRLHTQINSTVQCRASR